MQLNINSPAYYTQIYGIDDEIYKMCRELSASVREKKYSDYISVIGIVPVIAPKEEVEKGAWKEIKKCELKCGFASVSLQIDYKKYVESTMDEKKSLIVKNVVDSIKAIKTRGKIDFKLFESDMMKFCNENNINYIS